MDDFGPLRSRVTASDPDRFAPRAAAPRVWQVGALCRAVADSLDARFNPVAVRGEISGFSRASSGHLYFCLKDAQAQIRCAMFRRAAQGVDFPLREGQLVEAWGRLGVYEARGDLQLIVETLRPAGEGTLFERFVQLKARLDAEGLFDPARKRPVPELPKGIGIVTSLGAAALHDVATALARRAPHVPVMLAPALVQGPQAPQDLVRGLQALARQAAAGRIDVILLVRGGGSLEDLWAFNDESLARAIVASPVPVITGVGHETDFTIADFCADLRAPTPTAAAELAARPRDAWLDALAGAARTLRVGVERRLDQAEQRVDQAASRLGRPLARLGAQHVRLVRAAHRLQTAAGSRLERERQTSAQARTRLQSGTFARLDRAAHGLDRLGLRLELLDPRLVLQRGYALLTDEAGHAVTTAASTHPGQRLTAALADGEVPVVVAPAGRIHS